MAGIGARIADALQPMLAQSAREVPAGDGWVFEPKYDGIRVVAFGTEDGAALVTRNGRDKSGQFPEVAEAVRDLAASLGEPIVLDGEIVGVGRRGGLLRFESLQARMHVTDRAAIARLQEERPAALVAFDLLLLGDDTFVDEPLRERRTRLEEVLGKRTGSTLRLGEQEPEAGALLRRARAHDWEGVMAKRAGGPYRPGQRSRDWIKVKLEAQEEFVVGGWTEPRGARKRFGAILLGYYRPDGSFVYAGHTGAGFTNEMLEEMYRRLRRLERKTPPFAEAPRTNEKAHWTTPRVVVEVRFNEWTRDGKLRQPSFVAFREDKDAKEVVYDAAAEPPPKQERSPARKRREGRKTASSRSGASVRDRAGTAIARAIGGARANGDSTVRAAVGSGNALELTNLDKVFFPAPKLTKGDLLEYYAEMARYILPCMEDRPLVLKRFPGGVDGESFYQQAAPDEVPAGVRVEAVRLNDGEPQPRLVGGDLATLLYTIQLGAISYDPWHSRVGRLESADYSILDLDPGPGADFRAVIEVARLVRDEMEALGLRGALKTSGSNGLHVYLPLPEHTPLDAATLVAQIIATRVARSRPELATVKRMRRDRPEGTVYVDYLQNILGKTVAGVYAARAKPEATVSTPLAWDELTDDLDRSDFTIETVPGRVKRVGDLWASGMATPNDLEAFLDRAA